MKKSALIGVALVALHSLLTFSNAVFAAEPTITANATSVTVSVPAGYATGARLVLAAYGGDRGIQVAAWPTPHELCASLPDEGGDYSVTLADLGFADGNCVVRAFMQSEFEKLDYLIVDNANDYLDVGMLDNQVYGLEYGFTPKGGGNYGKTICAVSEGGAGTEFRFEGAGSTTRFNFCADSTSGSYKFVAANLNANAMNTVVARNSAITVNGTKLGDYRTTPLGLKGARVRLNTKNPSSAEDHSYGWWYYLKIWGSDGRELVDFIPVRRTSDNTVGFFDRAEKRFRTPTGGGAYTAGTLIADSAFTDYCYYSEPLNIASRTLELAIAGGVASVTVPAGFATGEKLYLVADEVDRGLSVEAWHDKYTLCAAIPAEGGTFNCTLSTFCTYGTSFIRVFAAEDFTKLVSLTASDQNDYRDIGVTDTLCYGFEYGYQPLNGSAPYGKTFAAVGGTVRLERAGNGNNPNYNYCVYNYEYNNQTTMNFGLNGNACNNIVFRNQELTHNGTSRGHGATAPIGKTNNMLRMNNRGLNSSDYDYGKWYYLRLYGRDGGKLVDYVPAKKANGTIGFVDLVNREFVTPTGGGDYSSDNVADGTLARIIRYTPATVYENPTTPVTAEWIGGTSTDLGAAANWRCRNINDEVLPDVLPDKEVTAVTVSGAFAFSIPTANDICWLTLKFEDAELAADVDWRGSFAGDLADGFTLDLKGHTLTLDTMVGNGTITDTAAAGGTVRVNVPANATVTNSGILLTGSLQLLKVGAGTFTAAKSGPSYAGGTVIEEGVAIIHRSAHPSGANASLTVCTNGVFDINGDNANDYAWYNVPITLAGGTIQNTGNGLNMGWAQLGTVRLTADSTITVSNGAHDYAFLAQGSARTLLDLGGHKLDLHAGGGQFRFHNTEIRNGLLNVADGGWVIFDGGTTDASTADIEFAPTPRWNVDQDLTVRNLVMRAYDEGNTINGSAKIKILGTFTPYSQYIHNYEMQNGSTIDLSVRNTVYPTVNPLKTQYKVTFAENATVTVDLHGREFTTELTKVMSWSAAPTGGVTFVLDAQTRRRNYVKVAADGLYVADRGATVIFVR